MDTAVLAVGTVELLPIPGRVEGPVLGTFRVDMALLQALALGRSLH